jgi:hypothetical protein
MTIDMRVMNQWLEVVQIASSLEFSDEQHANIWQFNSVGKYSAQSMYAIVNNRGIK